MLDSALLERIQTLEPADRLELIGIVWDSLSSTDLPVTDAEPYSTRVWPIWNRIPTIRAHAQK
jgi:hypothetical protein